MQYTTFSLKILVAGDFLGSSVRLWPLNAGGEVSVPGQGAKIPHASAQSKDMKQKQCCNKFHKDLKNGSHQKTLKKKVPK